MDCPNCGSKDERERFCNRCGQVLHGEPEISPTSESVPTHDEWMEADGADDLRIENSNTENFNTESSNIESSNTENSNAENSNTENLYRANSSTEHSNIENSTEDPAVENQRHHNPYSAQSAEQSSRVQQGQQGLQPMQPSGQPWQPWQNTQAPGSNSFRPIYRRNDSGWIAFLIIICIIALAVLGVFIEE
ncbi:hypothetical protein [uncultured Veillonella sp.]|uniref:hypothetical protein n=1 Tax=uncultured Veillonella sp. TaxID=159268 RepID=UPI002618B2E3|nr:hypothetical protein [uncultured Veillonella sp.]